MKRGQNSGSISQRKDGRWEARLTLPDGKRRSFYAPTWREAEAKLIEARGDLARGKLPASGRATVDDLWREYERVDPGSIRPSTMERRERDWRHHVSPVIGSVKLRDLGPMHVQRVIGQARADGLADSTVRHLLTVVKLVLAQGVRWGLLGANPAEGIQTRAPEPRVLPIDDPAQVSAFLDAARTDPEGLPVLLAVGLGLRSGEVRGLRWRDVDLDAGVIRIRQQAHTTRGEVHFAPLKTARSRRDLPIPGFIASALRDQKRAQNLRRLKAPRWEDHDLVVDGVAGRPIAVLTLLKRVRRICDRAGVPHLTFHDLRHLCATILLMEGVSPKVAQAILGHATVNMTMNVYSHVNRALLDDAASSMDRAADRLRKGRAG